MDRVKSRILSIAWGPPVPRQTNGQNANADSDSDGDDDDDWSDSWLVAGCSDSSLRKWDFSSGRTLERMGTDKIRGERTLVWAVGVLGWVFVVHATDPRFAYIHSVPAMVRLCPVIPWAL